MILYPAIDLKDGQCVRVVRGDLATATVFNNDPAAQAKVWAAAGFDWLHVIDLNGSVAGRAINSAAIEAILKSVSIPVQLGGGIRTLARADRGERGRPQGRGGRSGMDREFRPRRHHGGPTVRG
jgi:phosphoribosylformimino-5-aminoimidazole carboxamide ribotide isomerase